MSSGTARYLFYSHDSFGLGHLRRTLALAGAVSRRDQQASSLIITGSTVASSYRLPPRVDTVKLPVVSKDGNGDYVSLRVGLSFEEVVHVRSTLAHAAASSFRPSVAVIDKTPIGLRGELLATLELLKANTGCRLVLGLRDIEDSPSKVRREWRQAKLRDSIVRYYDAILVYGPASTMDAIDCMGWHRLGVPVYHVGYVGPPMPEAGPPDLAREYVLVTAGGGGDGFNVVETVLKAIRLRPLPVPVVIVTGPLMKDNDQHLLADLAAGLDVRLHEFRADMEQVIAGAVGVVSMAGYNTVAELLAARKPALLVPRVHPRREQIMRARALARAGLAETLHPDQLAPIEMRAALDRLLEREPPEPDEAAQNGASRAAEILGSLANGTAGGLDQGDDRPEIELSVRS